MDRIYAYSRNTGAADAARLSGFGFRLFGLFSKYSTNRITWKWGLICSGVIYKLYLNLFFFCSPQGFASKKEMTGIFET
jgi:hypothetical protein